MSAVICDPQAGRTDLGALPGLMIAHELLNEVHLREHHLLSGPVPRIAAEPSRRS